MATEKAEPDHGKQIKDFRERCGISTIIAVSGGALVSTEGMPEEVALAYVKSVDDRIRIVLSDCLSKFQNFGVAILTSGTRDGVPCIAVEVARELGLRVMFLYPRRAEKYKLDLEPDLRIVIDPIVGESQWGDDSPLFAQLLDGVVIIGGNTGTLTECGHIFKINESLVGHNKKPKFMAPIRGFGGVAEILPHFCFREEVRRACMPDENIWTGEAAGRFLFEHTSPVYQD